MNGFDRTAARILLRCGLGALILICGALFFRYLLSPLLPFFCALALAAIVKPFCDKLKARTRISYRFWCILLLALFTLFFSAVLWSLLSGVVGELTHLVSNGEELTSRVTEIYNGLFAFIERRLPALYRQIDREALTERLLEALSSLSLSASIHLARLAFSLPEAALFIVSAYLAAYYILVDGERLKKGALSLLPEGLKGQICALMGAIVRGVARYFKAGGVLLILTFVQLLIGFMVLDIRFPFLFALLVAAVDFLPVLGTGTVLIPWGIVLAVAGSPFKGVGLLILWVITLIVRQIAEPKIMGKSLGIHPLFSLLATYFGLKLFGIGGMLLFPIMLSVASGILEEKR